MSELVMDEKYFETCEEVYKFYSFVEKYGFCTPWCECSECSE